jgi:hypothetical protein
MSSKQVKSVILLILTCFCLSATACPVHNSTDTTGNNTAPTDNAATAVARQATVDSLHALWSSYALPQIANTTADFARQDGWFDVNQYFSVLTHLSMQPGYVLDYVYHNNGSAGQPYLYARKTDSKPFATLAELTASYSDATNDHSYDYLAYVQTDGTAESYFQYIVLRIMGGQFYLWWHAAYNDHSLACDRTKLEALLADTAPLYDQTIPSATQKAARLITLSPKVEINGDTAAVRVVIFTKWGGFIEETYTITRSFPHTITDIKTTTLVPWQINLTF